MPVFIVWLIGHPEFLEKEIQKVSLPRILVRARQFHSTLHCTQRRYITIVDTPQPESPEATKEQINKIKHAMRRRPSNDSSEKVE